MLGRKANSAALETQGQQLTKCYSVRAELRYCCSIVSPASFAARSIVSAITFACVMKTAWLAERQAAECNMSYQRGQIGSAVPVRAISHGPLLRRDLIDIHLHAGAAA